MSLNLCRQVLGLNDGNEIMKTYDEVLQKVMKQEEEAKNHEEQLHSPKLEGAPGERLSSNNRPHINEVLTELLAELKTHIHDAVGSTHRRQSVLPFEEFQYPDYDPNAQDSGSEYGSEDEEEAGDA